MIRERITCASPVRHNSAVHYRKPPSDPRRIIEHLRIAKGFRSVRALAIAAGINQPTLSRYLASKSETMEVDKFTALAQTLGVTVSELLGEVPLSSGSPVREVTQVMARMSQTQQIRFLRVGEALADEDDTPAQGGG